MQPVGGWPPEEEDPTLEQLSALQKRTETQDAASFVDFAIYVPFGQRALKALKFRSFVLTVNGYITKELPGSATFTQLRTSAEDIVADAGRRGPRFFASLRAHRGEAIKDLPNLLAPHLQC